MQSLHSKSALDIAFKQIDAIYEQKRKELTGPYCPYCDSSQEGWYHDIKEEFDEDQMLKCQDCEKEFIVVLSHHFSCREIEDNRK